MNTGQMMLTVGAFFLLAVVILTVNRGLLSNNSVMIDNRYGILGVSLANSMMERATSKAFDEQSDTLGLTSINSLTAVNSLGLDAGETINNPDSFDDFDDFDCYQTTPKSDTLLLEGTDKKVIFNTYCQVDYVEASNPEKVSANRTWHKRLIVTVTSTGLEHSINLSTIYSYWYFR
jgi:hypothetical protein